MEQKRMEVNMDILSFGLTAFVFWTAVVMSIICISQTPSSIKTFILIWAVVLVGWAAAPYHNPGWLFYLVVLLSSLYILGIPNNEWAFGTGWAVYFVAGYISRFDDPNTAYFLAQKRQHIDTVDGWLDFTLSWCIVHWVFIAFALVCWMWVKLGLFLYAVHRKSLLIRAICKDLPEVAARTEKTEPEDRVLAGKKLMQEIAIDGLAKVHQAKGSVVNISQNDERPFFDAAESVYTHQRSENHSYINRRQGVRNMIDALDSLIGRTKSIDSAWEKTIEAMRFRYVKNEGEPDEDKRLEIPWLYNFAKLMGLPRNMARDPYFLDRLEQAKERNYPPGVFSLWLAVRSPFCNYKRIVHFAWLQRYRTGPSSDTFKEWNGEKGYEQMLKYKVHAYDRIAQEFPYSTQ
jgi:hypothetical protein